MLNVKRVVILLFVAVVLYFWVVSIFSEKNAPGRGGRYVYSNSIDNEKRESDNTFGSFEKPAPPSESPVEGGKPRQAPGNGGGPRPGGQGQQPEPPKPPQPSAIPPEIPHPTPAPPKHVEVAHTQVPPGSKGNEENIPSDAQQEKPVPTPSTEGQSETPMPGGTVKPAEDAGSKVVGIPEKPKTSNAEAIKKFNPKDIVLEDYFNQRLNIQIACPKGWTISQSKTQPQFKCASDDIDDLFFICKRSRIMEGRKFNEEINAIVKNEIFGKDLQDKTVKTRAIGKYNLSRITFNEFEINSNEIKSMKNHLIYVFIESGDEVSMFYYVTPYKLKDKVLPIFEKTIKSIKIIKRPEPAGTK